MEEKIYLSENEAVIFYSVAEYCDHYSKLIIKIKDKEVQTEVRSSGRIDIKTGRYKTGRKAYRAFKMSIAEAILGGRQVLNLFPKKVEWKKDTEY